MNLSRYKKYKKTYQAYHEANREHDLNLQRQWREKHPNYAKNRAKRWREEHPNYDKEYCQKNPERMKVLRARSRRKWRRNNSHKHRIHNLVYRYPNRYPLDDRCAFCGVMKKLEHGHLDYEDDGQNYLTVCHACNYWMDKAIGG